MSLLFSFLVFLCSGICSAPEETVLEVQFGQPARAALRQSESPDGGARILLHVLEKRLRGPEFPADGPFPLAPGPVFAWELTQDQIAEAARFGSLTLESPDASFPKPFETLRGRYRAQLALRLGGAPFQRQDEVVVTGSVSDLELEADQPRIHEMQIDGPVAPPPRTIEPGERIQAIALASPILARTARVRETWRTSDHRGFVVLPDAYDELNAPRRRWPVIYMIPGSKTALEHARAIAKILHEPMMKALIPQAIWVVLDPKSAYGHHFFTNTPLQGHRAEALVTELIPWLDVRYRTIDDQGARLLVGEEQGGRAALTLLLEHPDVFSNAWAFSPDAVSFEALGCIDLVRDANAFVDQNGAERPAMRTVLSEDREIVHLDVMDEILLSETLSRNGRSAQKWDELRATFGTLQTRNDLARWPFDPETGRMRPAEVMHWMTLDLAERVRTRTELARRLTEDARIFIGENDERYRNLGVRHLQRTVENALVNEDPARGPWVVEIEDSNATSTNAISRLPAHDEMATLLRERGFHD